MCVHAAVRAGAGMVRFVGGDALASALAVSTPEAVRSEHAGAHRVQAWAVGSGATDRAQQAQVEQALDAGVPVLADAAAIEMLAHRAADGDPAPAHVLLTPHAGELAQALEWVARLAPERGERLVRAAREAGLPRMRRCRLPRAAPRSRRRPSCGCARPGRRSAGPCCSRAPRRWSRPRTAPCGPTAATGVAVHRGLRGHPLRDPRAGLAAHRARVEAGRAEGADGEWAAVAAAGLLVQRGISTAAPGPCRRRWPPSGSRRCWAGWPMVSRRRPWRPLRARSSAESADPRARTSSPRSTGPGGWIPPRTGPSARRPATAR
ncbi:Uncharacterized conserved protein [Rothia kristinae]|nr:Uncharacterized conserved protein [Rothia kristinae]